jgi:hypothetical protein
MEGGEVCEDLDKYLTPLDSDLRRNDSVNHTIHTPLPFEGGGV